MFGFLQRLFGSQPAEDQIEYQHEPIQDTEAVQFYQAIGTLMWFAVVEKNLELSSRLVQVPTEDMIREITLEHPFEQKLPDLSVPFVVWLRKEMPPSVLRHFTGLNHLVGLEVSFHPELRGADVAQLAGLPRLSQLFARWVTTWKEADLEAVAGMSGLRLLNLEGSTAGDDGVGRLTRIRELKHLNLNDSNITDTSLERLPQLKQLETLHISRTQITNAGMAHLAQMPQLKSLALRELKINDAGFKHFAKLSNLEYLDVGRSLITDQSLELLEGFPMLKYLEVGTTGVSDAGMKRIGRCSNLEYLSLHEQPITDRGFAHIAGLKQLRTVDLSGCPITDESVDVLLDLPELKELTLNLSSVSKKQINRIRKVIEARSGVVYG